MTVALVVHPTPSPTCQELLEAVAAGPVTASLREAARERGATVALRSSLGEG